MTKIPVKALKNIKSEYVINRKNNNYKTVKKLIDIGHLDEQQDENDKREYKLIL